MAAPGNSGTPHSGTSEPDSSEWDCAVCADVLVDPVVGTCGHDFCSHCYTAWRVEHGRTSCPVCRAALPETIPRVCLRLKAAVEAAAGPRVAARRLEIEKIVEDQRRREREAEEERRRREREAEERRRREREAEEQRRREREAEERRRREREAEERRRREREAEERRRREREAEEEWRRRERRADPQQAQILSGHLSEEALVRASVEAGQRLAAALPLTPPPHLAAYSLERSAEESRWLSYEAGWQRTASLRAGADPPTFARELQLHMHVLRVPRLRAGASGRPLLGRVGGCAFDHASREQQEEMRELSVHWARVAAHSVPRGLAPFAGPASGEVSAKESRWLCMQVHAPARQQHRLQQQQQQQQQLVFHHHPQQQQQA